MQTWHSTTREGKPFTLTLSEETIHWQDSENHTAGVVEFFKMHNPFDELSLADQVQLIHSLSELVVIKYERGQQISDILAFWKYYPDLQIADRTFSFETKITDVSRWNLHLNKNGLIWHDLSSHYSQTNRVIEQNFADFWFYGPVYPLP